MARTEQQNCGRGVKIHMGKFRPLLTLFIIIASLGLIATIAIPNFSGRRETAPKNTCINNLRLIDAAIQQWALENNKTNSDSPTWEDIKKYLARGGSEIPKCPLGGTYKMGTVLDRPTCSYPGHVLQ